MRRNNRHREYESAGFEDRRGRHHLAFLIAGIGIGSAVALLLAPNSGEEIRHSIGRSYRKAVKKIGRHSDDLRERADRLDARIRRLGDAR